MAYEFSMEFEAIQFMTHEKRFYGHENLYNAEARPQELIGFVWYINILMWLRGFQVKPLYFVLFSLYLSLFWELRDKRYLKNLQFWAESLGAIPEYWCTVYQMWPIERKCKSGPNQWDFHVIQCEDVYKIHVGFNCNKLDSEKSKFKKDK